MFPEPSSRGAASDLSALSHAQNERALDLLRRATEAHQRRAKAEQGRVLRAAHEDLPRQIPDGLAPVAVRLPRAGEAEEGREEEEENM